MLPAKLWWKPNLFGFQKALRFPLDALASFDGSLGDAASL